MQRRNGDPTRGRSTGELVKDLSRQVSTLARQEVELAKLEMAEKGKKAGIGGGLLAGAAVAALLALGSLTAFLILALSQGMEAWLAALLVTALWAAIGIVLALVGRQKLEEVGTPIPEETIESVKEDVEWLKSPNR